MLLYALPMKKSRCWVLDLTGPPQAPAALTAPSIYALVVSSPAAAVLSRAIAGRAGLLVIRLEAVPPSNEALLRRLELAWLLVAAREELPVRRRRGPNIQWSGDPGQLRQALRLARKRHWPSLWVRALRPLCDNRALPDRLPTPAPNSGGPTATARKASHSKAARPATAGPPGAPQRCG